MKIYCHYVFSTEDELTEPTVSHKLPLEVYKSIGRRIKYIVFLLIHCMGYLNSQNNLIYEADILCQYLMHF
jgi:hypothetical protein